MNSSKLFFSLILFSGFLTLSNPQTEQQIQQRLKQEGISTKADVTEELKKRNMTEDDARRLAKQYGMDYDSFIATYILGGSTPPTVTNVTNTPAPTESGLEYFEYNLFKNIPTSFEPSETGAVDPGYIIGPRNNLRLSMWEAAEFQYQLIVDQQGNVFIPTAGQFFVSGTSYESLQKKLTM